MRKAQMELITPMVTLMIVAIIGVLVAIPIITDLIADAETNEFTEQKISCEDITLDYTLGDTVTVPDGTVNSRIYAWDTVAGYTGTDRPMQLWYEDLQYTLDEAGGLVFDNDYLTITNGTFVSNFDTLVYVYLDNSSTATWENSKLMYWNTSTVEIYNCSNSLEIWDTTGNFTRELDVAGITILSTGTMADNTEYCFDAVGSTLHESTEITTADEFYICYYSEEPALSNMILLMLNLIPIILAIVILLAFVGYVGMAR